MSSTPRGLFDTVGPSQSDKNKTYKIPDNPYLSQKFPTPSRNENSAVLQQSTNSESSVRQRRPLQEQQQLLSTKKQLSLFNPPKSSMSLGTARKSIPVDQARSQFTVRRMDDDAILPSNVNCWIMVFGIPSKELYDSCKEYFSSYGSIIATRGTVIPGRQNWVAFQYENPLQAEKAHLGGQVEIHQGIFVGVRALPDNDPILLQSASGELDNLWGKSSPAERLSSTADGELTEKDLFIGKKDKPDLPKKRNCFDRFMCWILRLDDTTLGRNRL